MLKNNTILRVFLGVIFAVSVSVLTAQNITSPQVKAYPVSQMHEKVSNSIGSKKTLVSLDKLSAAYQHSTWYYQGKLNSNPRINSLVLNGMISLAGTPFDFQAVDFASTSVSSNTINLAKLRFNKEQMLSSLQGKLKEIADLESLLGSNFIDLVTERQLLVDRIKEAFNASINFPSAEYTLITNKIFSDAEIFKLGPVAAFDKLASSLRDSLANYHKSITILKQKMEKGFEGLEDSIVRLHKTYESIQNISQGLSEQRDEILKKWSAINASQSVRTLNQSKREYLQQQFNNPEVLKSLSRKYLKLNGLQRLLLDIRKLNIGTFGENNGIFSTHNLLMNGLSFESVKKGKVFAPVVGILPSKTQIADISHNSIFNSLKTFAGGLTMGKESRNGGFSRINVMMYQQSADLFANPLEASTKNIVTSISRNICIGDNQRLLIEISKSVYSMHDVQGNQNKGAFINSGNIFGNLGINLNHFGEYDRIGLTTDVSVRYTGQEYLNLGNTFIPGGSKEMSGNLRKYLLEDKLQLQAKFQYREYDFSANSKTWQYASWSFSGKWKFSKGQFFELRYQPFNNSRKEQSTRESQNSANRFSVRGNIQARLSKGVLYRNYLDITTFDNIMEHLASALEQNTNAVTLTSLQTLSLKNRTYFLNSVYNHTRARSEFLFLNSSLTIDGGSTFQIKDGLMLNCAIVYNSVQGFYSNGSLRQGISGRILGRFDLSGFVQSGIFFYKEAGASGISPFSGNVLISYKIK